ncbi:hypothetical protein B0H17DRAFT_1213214 [Mycena rosella]|uniref:Uncharacterized protein n=1 Tax=Mycena rosella TaxID=1033263 RepID=A0AAD7CQM4_MYCRO|nr:hypothetical protein B0H17DRAFT_1213214 [Mycena rosella]
MKRAIINCGNSIWVLLEGECSEVHPPNVIVGPDILINSRTPLNPQSFVVFFIRGYPLYSRRADCAFPFSHSFADAQKSGSIRHPLSFSILIHSQTRRNPAPFAILSVSPSAVIRRRADIRLHRILSVSVVTSLEPQTHPETIMHEHFKRAGAWIRPEECDWCTVNHREKFDYEKCGGRRGIIQVAEGYLGLLGWPVIRRAKNA